MQKTVILIPEDKVISHAGIEYHPVHVSLLSPFLLAHAEKTASRIYRSEGGKLSIMNLNLLVNEVRTSEQWIRAKEMSGRTDAVNKGLHAASTIKG